MKKGLTWLAVLALAAPAGVRAQGEGGVICLPPIGATVVQQAVATATIGSQTFDLMQCWTRLDKYFSVDALVTSAQGSATIHVLLNPDPFVNFSIATTNFVAGPTLFQFTFGTPIVPGFYSSANSSLGGSVTDGPAAEVTVTNSGTDPFLVGNGTVAGLPVPPSIPGNLGVDIGTGPCVTGAAHTRNCPFPSAVAGANSFGPTFYDDLDATVTYLQSGLGSQATFSGSVELLATPEPATVALLASGLVLLVGATRRRQS